MADLYQSEFEEIKQRRGVQDLDNLIAVLDLDGSVTVVEDPTKEEILKAREDLAAANQAAQDEADAAGAEAAAEAEADQEAAAELAKLTRTAAMPVPEDEEEPAVPDQELPPEPEAQTEKKAAAK